ncbi:hypothetical protein C8Q76DRAFT_211883 [Earliella scabrosa]|nr:hypothetical protein C8Q76DRAFT_211883 [Earliella scabrosa]
MGCCPLLKLPKYGMITLRNTWSPASHTQTQTRVLIYSVSFMYKSPSFRALDRLDTLGVHL